MKPVALIIRAAGTNCDRELAYAFESAGAETTTVHLNRLIEQPGILQKIDLVGFPGGFSYGDDIAAGRIFANRIRMRLIGPLQAAVERGVPMIGVCNGFQVLVKAGLLPDIRAGRQTTTLTDNASGRFMAKWVGLEAVEDSVCVWTRGLGRFELPIAHGEGRFIPESKELLNTLRERHQVALRYGRYGIGCVGGDGGNDDRGRVTDQKGEVEAIGADNPNGSADRIAGICDPSGLVLGLMPHPERFVHPTHHPRWTRQAAEALAQTPAGLRVFQNAVEYVMQVPAQPGRPGTMPGVP